MSAMRLACLPLLFIVAWSAAACGQKGPLLLPDAKTKAPVPATAPAPPDDKKDKDKPAPARGDPRAGAQ